MSEILLEPFEQALISLRTALNEKPDAAGHYAIYIRDSVIQRFEYTYELAWKTAKRFLAFKAGMDEDVVAQIFRRCAEIGLIDDTAQWLAFHRARNLTTHTYNTATADAVYREARAFCAEAEKLLQRMKERLP